jgi:hypothetical protein
MLRILLILPFLVFIAVFSHAQDTTKGIDFKPAIGAVGSPFKPTVSVLVSYPITTRWSVAAHSLCSFLLVSSPKVKYIKTNYNYSLMQLFGIGYSLYGKKGHATHTALLMGGLKCVAFSETLNNPGLDEKVTTALHTTVPEYGVMYSFSTGRGRCTFTTRLYLPLHPLQYYPLGTLNNLAYLECGAGWKFRKK